MSQLSGTCPVCQKPLLKEEDIVTCPSCGARYHRACYQQVGDCVFSAQHGPGFEYPPPAASEESSAPQDDKGTLCPHCQTVNQASHIFCENCGKPLHAAEPAFSAAANSGAPPAPRPTSFSPFSGSFPTNLWGYGPQNQYAGAIDGISANEWAEFIGSSAPVYIPRLTLLERQKHKISFLFSAFLISPAYFAFRKMWGWAAISLAATLVTMLPQLFLAAASQGQVLPIELSLDTWSFIAMVANYINLAMQLFFGMFSLSLYKGFAAKKMRALRQEADNDANYHDALIRKGGTSTAGVLLVMAALVLFGFITALFFGNSYIAYFYPNLMP